MPAEFSFTDQEFIDVVNRICSRETPLGQTFNSFTSIDESLLTEQLDSMGIVIFFVWLSELFGIPEDEVKSFMEADDFTLAQLKAFVAEHATRSYTYAEAEEFEARCI